MGLFLCGLTSHLEVALHPLSLGRPILVGEWDERVVAVSPEAATFGPFPGQSVAQALKLCPQAEVFEPRPDESGRLAERLAAALYDLAPGVEVRIDGRSWMDLAGVPDPGASIREARRRLRQATGEEPRLGLAAGPFTARVAASRARPGRLIRVESPRSYLSPLPAAELPLDREQMERLELLGLRTLGAVAGIGPRQMESQLGPMGRLAVALARGEEPLPIRPWQPPRFTTAHRQFDVPVEDREALLFVARGLCDELGSELGRRGAGARRVRATLVIEDAPQESRESLVRHPLSSAAELFGLLSAWLREWLPAGPVAEIRVELPELERAGRRQLRLWVGGDGTGEEVAAAIERLQDRFGEEVATRPIPALMGSVLSSLRSVLRPL